MKKSGYALAFAIGSVMVTGPMWANSDRKDVIIESRSIASWPRSPEERPSVSGDRWLQIQAQMESMQKEIQLLRGLAEENRYQIEQLDHQQQAMYTQPEPKLASDVVVFSVEAPPETMPEEVSFPSQPDELYQLAHQQMQSKDYSGAMATFQQYLIAFADTGEYLPNVHYWLGEIHLLSGNIDAADTEFETVVHQYPEHQKASDALLKRGYVQYTKEQWTLARAYFNDVKARFPGTAAARLAEARLIQMKQNSQL